MEAIKIKMLRLPLGELRQKWFGDKVRNTRGGIVDKLDKGC